MKLLSQFSTLNMVNSTSVINAIIQRVIQKEQVVSSEDQQLLKQHTVDFVSPLILRATEPLSDDVAYYLTEEAITSCEQIFSLQSSRQQCEDAVKLFCICAKYDRSNLQLLLPSLERILSIQSQVCYTIPLL